MNNLQDALRDIVQHIIGLGTIELIKVTGTATETVIGAKSTGQSMIVVNGKFKNPITEFVGEFGMPNLGKLAVILGIEEYKEDAQISVTSRTINGVEEIDGIHFENKVGDFSNDYRFMSASIVNAKVEMPRFKGVKWDVSIVPTVLAIQRLKFQASANSEEITFIAKVENGDLNFYFGNTTSHAGNFVFQQGVTGTLNKAWSWPVTTIIGILNLPGDKTMHFSDAGAAMITIDSGICVYNYIIPALTK